MEEFDAYPAKRFVKGDVILTAGVAPQAIFCLKKLIDKNPKEL